MTGLDERVLVTLGELRRVNDVPPTVREIAEALGFRSPAGVHASLVRMRQEGRVTWRDGQPRTLRIVN